MDGVLDILFSASFWAAAIRIATPYMFGVLGALLCERSGVLNLGIEGIFTAGAMAGWMSVYLGADLWGGARRPRGCFEPWLGRRSPRRGEWGGGGVPSRAPPGGGAARRRRRGGPAPRPRS